MKNRIARTLGLIVLVAAFSPLCRAHSSFTGDLHRTEVSKHSGWAHLSLDIDLNNSNEKYLEVSLELFGFSLNLSSTWDR
ncbi:MAG: hypothetical protein ABR912_04535 [Terracidiphilus sp.]|jgi:hypothetical protein